MHNHPLFGTVWADLAELPPILDQSSALGGGTLVVVDEYEGPVNDATSARRAVEKMGDASMALLAGHGVFVLGGSARAVHQRAVALEQRCQHAWYATAAGGTGASRVPQSFIDLVAQSDGEGFLGFWEAAVRAELAADPDLLDCYGGVPKTSLSSIGTGASSWAYVHESGSRSGRQRTKDVACRNRSCCRWS